MDNASLRSTLRGRTRPKIESCNKALEKLESVYPDQAEGREVTVRSVLDEAADRLESTDTPASGKPAVEQEAETQMRAVVDTLMRVLGPEHGKTVVMQAEFDTLLEKSQPYSVTVGEPSRSGMK